MRRPTTATIVVVAVTMGVVAASATVGTGVDPIDRAVEAGVGTAADVGAGAVGAVSSSPSANRTKLRLEIHRLINRERANEGLGNLSYSPQLEGIAQNHSEDMARRSYYSHVSPTGGTLSDRYSDAGVFCSAGENIDKTSTDPSDERAFAEDVVSAWMNSEGHRANILSYSYSTQGIGIATMDGTTYVTQNFC